MRAEKEPSEESWGVFAWCSAAGHHSMVADRLQFDTGFFSQRNWEVTVGPVSARHGPGSRRPHRVNKYKRGSETEA